MPGREEAREEAPGLDSEDLTFFVNSIDEYCAREASEEEEVDPD